MADLELNQRLQPALLDRLIDDERTIALIIIATQLAALERLRLPEKALVEILAAQGMTLRDRQARDDLLELHFTASRAHANPAQLRALVLRPPGSAEGIALQSFATVQSSSTPNVELEPAERRM